MRQASPSSSNIKRAAPLAAMCLLMILASGCSGSGGSGTQDFNPRYWEDGGAGSEATGEKINPPKGYSLPSVSIIEPASGTVVTPGQDKIFVRALTENGDRQIKYVRINDEYYKPGKDGNLSGYFPLASSGRGFDAIEVSAVDSEGYAGRDRVAVLRGTPVPMEKMIFGAVGIEAEQGILDMATKLDPFMNAVLEGGKEINLEFPPVAVEIIEPFKAEVELSLKGVSVKMSHDISIDMLRLKTPDAADSARIDAGLCLNGVEISADARFISLSGLPIPEGIAPVHVTITINDVSSDLQVHVENPNRIEVSLSSLDIDIGELTADISSGMLLGRFAKFLNVTQEKYLISIPIRGWLAETLSRVLGRIVDSTGLDLAVKTKDISLSAGMLMDALDGLPDGIPQGLRYLTLGVEMERIAGDESTLEAVVGMAAWVDKSSPARSLDSAISMPPSISLADALANGREASLALALSADAVNRLSAALADTDFSMEIALSKILPSLGLPDDMKAKIALDAPPVMDFRDGQIRMAVPNLMVGLFMKDAEQLDIALDLAAIVTPDIVFRNGNYYLDLDLKLESFEICYLADRLGVHDAIDLESAVSRLLPQIMAALKPFLEKTPLSISNEEIDKLLNFAGSYVTIDDSTRKMLGTLPQFRFTLKDLKQEGSYLSVFIDSE